MYNVLLSRLFSCIRRSIAPPSIPHLAFLLTIILSHSQARSAGRDDELFNEHPNKTWSEVVGGLFTKSPKSIAVVIAISEYIGEKDGGYPPLRSARHDAEKMVQFLTVDAGFDIVYVLTEDKVTKSRLEQLMLDKIRTIVGPDDRFLFYWSGHGDQLETYNAKYGFLPLTNSRRNEFSSMVSMDDISRWNLYITARHSLFILDSCLSGLAGYETKGSRDDRLEQLSKPAHHLLAAGEAGENVLSGDRWNGSLFTDSFIKGAKGEALSRDGVVSLWSLLDYIQSRVLIEKEAVNWKNTLTPHVSILSSGTGAFFFTPSVPARQTAPTVEDNVNLSAPVQSNVHDQKAPSREIATPNKSIAPLDVDDSQTQSRALSPTNAARSFESDVKRPATGPFDARNPDDTAVTPPTPGSGADTRVPSPTGTPRVFPRHSSSTETSRLRGHPETPPSDSDVTPRPSGYKLRASGQSGSDVTPRPSGYKLRAPGQSGSDVTPRPSGYKLRASGQFDTHHPDGSAKAPSTLGIDSQP